MARTREFDTEAAVTAAMQAFRRTGYGGTSVRDLAKAMELGSGSIYAAFGSKEGLYLAALDLYRRRYALPFIEMLRAGGEARETIRAAFAAVIDEVTCGPGQASCLIVGAAMERAHSDEQVAERLRATTQMLELTLFETIAEAQGRGEIPAEQSAADLAGFLAMTFQGLRVMGAINPDRAALTRTAEVALNCLR